MSSRKVKKLNGKVLHDAREYLTLVKQVVTIQKAVAGMGDELDASKRDFIERLKPIIEISLPVAEEVNKCVNELNALPSTAPSHKRRAAGRKLSEMLAERADNMQDLFKAILESVSFVDTSVGEAEKENVVNEQ